MTATSKNTLPAGRAENAKQYYGLDVMKTVMAVLVIVIHRSPFRLGLAAFTAQNIFGRLAVPFFFAAAGLLFFRPAQDGGKKTNAACFRYIKRLVLLYAVWTLLYMPAAAYRFDFETYGVIKFFLNYAKRSLLEVSIIHLWYLLALIVAVCIVFVLSKKLGYGTILILSTGVYALYLLTTEFNSLAIKIPLFELFQKAVEQFPVAGIKNGVFIGFVFVASGAFIANRKFTMPGVLKWSLLSVSILLVAAEALGRRYFGQTEYLNAAVFHVPATCLLLLTASQAQLKERKIYLAMRQTNSLIYFAHLLVITEWYKLIFADTALEQLSKVPVVFFAFTFCYTLVFSFAVIWLEEKKPFGFLKYIH